MFIFKSLASFRVKKRKFLRMTDSASRPARPLSPHLQIYKPQITSVLSILHRATGIGLCAALPVVVYWLVALTRGPEEYNAFMSCMNSWPGKLFLMGWSWALSYHLCTGIRHLVWDIGCGLELKQVYQTGYATLAASSLFTLLLWLMIWQGAS